MTRLHSSPDSIATLKNPADNLRTIKAELNIALKEAGLSTDSVAITAVSKKQDEARIISALDAGHRVFGENQVQEAGRKWPSLKQGFPDVELRLIDPLQSNKVKEAVALFDVIETVDRPKIARMIGDEMRRQGRRLKLLVQVNTGEESQKAGISPDKIDAFIDECASQHGLEISGLMCIPPVADDPAPHFALLSKIARRYSFSELSMGMSADYSIAAQLGATHVRVGTGVFGPRG